LKGVKTDSDRQNNLKRFQVGLKPELLNQIGKCVGEKVEIFKKSEHSQINKHTHPKQMKFFSLVGFVKNCPSEKKIDR